MTVLCLFLVGFSMLITAMNTPFYELLDGEDEDNEFSNCPPATSTTEIKGWRMPVQVLIKLFFSLFGLSNDREMNMTPRNPAPLTYLFQFVFGLYMLVTTVVLINLLIAMMSDTYQRIQQQSDVEWKFGLAKLIRSMHRTDMAPSPINLVTTWLVYLLRICKRGKRTKVEDYSKMTNGSGKSSGGLFKKADNNLSVPDSANGGMGSSASFKDGTKIEHVLDWPNVVKKYYAVVKNNAN